MNRGNHDSTRNEAAKGAADASELGIKGQVQRGWGGGEETSAHYRSLWDNNAM